MRFPEIKSNVTSGITLNMILVLARKRRFFTVSVLSWLIMAVLAVTVLVPQVKLIVEALTQLQEKETELTAITAKVSALQGIDTSLLTADIAVLETALPSQKPVLPLLYSLDKLAGASQVAISNFQVSPGDISTSSADLMSGTSLESQLAPGVLALPLDLDVTGSFSNMNTFFKTLDDVVPLIHVTSIEFAAYSGGSAQASATSSALFQANVSLESLYTANKKPGLAAAEKVDLTPEEKNLVEKLRTAYQTRQADLALQQVQTATSGGRTNLFKL